jgi:hypothetical protein
VWSVGWGYRISWRPEKLMFSQEIEPRIPARRLRMSQNDMGRTWQYARIANLEDKTIHKTKYNRT